LNIVLEYKAVKKNINEFLTFRTSLMFGFYLLGMAFGIAPIPDGLIHNLTTYFSGFFIGVSVTILLIAKK